MRPLALGNRFEILNGVDGEDMRTQASSEEEVKTGKQRRSSNHVREVKKVASSKKEKQKRKQIDVKTDLFNQLPDNVKYLIFSKLMVPFEILLRVQYVCSPWRKLSKDPRLYRVVDERDLDYFASYFGRYFCKSDCYSCGYVSEDNYCGKCMSWKAKWIREAVVRSCGQLNELHIAYCVEDDLLRCIFDKSKYLKCFVLERGWQVSEGELIEAVRKAPLLEEVDLGCFSCNEISNELIAEIGRSCLNLKQFAMSIYDDQAFVIAENMPKLGRLRLWGNLTNEGLQAILDGCPYLEHLDIRRCFGIKIDEKLREQCGQRLKHVEWNQYEKLLLDRSGPRFRLPLVSDDDYDSHSDSSF